MKYTDIDPRKTAFIFELDNVLYPEKDYLFQAYYLFAGYLEYLDLIDEKEAVNPARLGPRLNQSRLHPAQRSRTIVALQCGFDRSR